MEKQTKGFFCYMENSHFGTIHGFSLFSNVYFVLAKFFVCDIIKETISRTALFLRFSKVENSMKCRILLGLAPLGQKGTVYRYKRTEIGEHAFYQLIFVKKNRMNRAHCTSVSRIE